MLAVKSLQAFWPLSYTKEGTKVKDLSDNLPSCPRQTASHSHDQSILLVNEGRPFRLELPVPRSLRVFPIEHIGYLFSEMQRVSGVHIDEVYEFTFHLLNLLIYLTRHPY